jgi:2-aminobenzoate-CoA ligase
VVCFRAEGCVEVALREALIPPSLFLIFWGFCRNNEFKLKEARFMAEIPVEFLPPKEHLPEKIYALPELRYPYKINLAVELLDKHVERNPEKVAILFEDQRITYRELQEKVNRLANGLRKLGIEKNDRVILRAPNRPEYIIANFACWRIGAIPVLCNHLVKKDEVVFRANDSQAKAIIVKAEYAEEVDKGRSEFESLEKYIVFGERREGYIFFDDIINENSPECETEDTTKEDIGRLIYSSGTTGKPKGIICTLSDILACSDTHGKYVLGLRESDVIGGHPFFTFAFGSVNFTFHPWRVGATLSIIERFTPEKMFELIEKHRITVLCCVPTAFNMMLQVEDAEKRYDLSSLRLCQSAGEWLPGKTFKEWKRRFGVEILDSLGSGDFMYVISTREGVPESKIGSTGIPVPGVECKIVDENFNEVPRGTVGELVLRGPFGQQYWRRPDKQREGVWNGWNRPGLEFMEDEDGYFWYKGRTDDMIVSAGYKIPGGEVEAALCEHEAVAEAAVVASPDEVRGSIVKAFVVLKPGYEPSDELRSELQEFVKQKIEPYKYPREIEFWRAEDLPRTSTGKIERYKLRMMEEEKKRLQG